MSERGKWGHFWWGLDPVNSLRWVLSNVLLQSQEHIVSLYQTGAGTLGQVFVSYTLASSMKIRFRTECSIQRFKHSLVQVVYGIHCFKALCFAFIKRVRKIAKSDLASSCLSFRPSVCMEQLGSHWTDFHEIWYLGIFRKLSRFY
jgi:hypothetical protein